MGTLTNRSRRQRAAAGGLAVWVALIAVLFLWQLIEYRGIVALEAEWQFNFLGRSYPAISYLLPVAILALPALLFFGRARRRRSADRVARATFRSAAAFRKMLLTVCAMFGAAALVFLFLALYNPSGQPLQRIDLSQPVVAVPDNGPAVISGSLVTMSTAALHQNFLSLRNSQRFAPIVPPRTNERELQFFVELSPTAALPDANAANTVSGTLRRDALPGEIVRLYRYAGYRITEPHYVLFVDRTSLMLPDLQTAAQLGIVSLVFGLLGFLQHRRMRKIGKAVAAERSEPEPIPTPGLT